MPTIQRVVEDMDDVGAAFLSLCWRMPHEEVIRVIKNSWSVAQLRTCTLHRTEGEKLSV